MGCCMSQKAKPPLSPDSVGPRLRERDEQYFYELTFPSRPLHVTLTSSKYNTDGYITAFQKDCPIQDIAEKLAINSKVIKVNGTVVEGCEVTLIAKALADGKLPIRMLLAHPDGLKSGECPENDPDTIVHLEGSVPNL